MKLSKKFIELIENNDNEEGDALLAVIDEPDIPFSEIMVLAIEFLDTVPEYEGDVPLKHKYAYDNVLEDDVDDVDDDEMDDDDVDEEDDILEDDEEL